MIGQLVARMPDEKSSVPSQEAPLELKEIEARLVVSIANENDALSAFVFMVCGVGRFVRWRSTGSLENVVRTMGLGIRLVRVALNEITYARHGRAGG